MLYGRLATTAVGAVGPVSGRCQLVTANRQDVAVQHSQSLDLTVGVFGYGLRQPIRQHRVDFDGDHRGAAIEQSQRERPEARTDFQDQVRPTDPRG